MGKTLLVSRSLSFPRASHEEVENCRENVQRDGCLTKNEVVNFKDLVVHGGGNFLTVNFCIVEEGSPVSESVVRRSMSEANVRPLTFAENVSVKKMSGVQFDLVAKQLGLERKMSSAGSAKLHFSEMVFIPLGTVVFGANAESEFLITCLRDRVHGSSHPSFFPRNVTTLPPLWVYPVCMVRQRKG